MMFLYKISNLWHHLLSYYADLIQMEKQSCLTKKTMLDKTAAHHTVIHLVVEVSCWHFVANEKKSTALVYKWHKDFQLDKERLNHKGDKKIFKRNGHERSSKCHKHGYKNKRAMMALYCSTGWYQTLHYLGIGLKHKTPYKNWNW